jgi:hypothetical protein
MMEKYDMKTPSPQMSIPQELLESQDGIGVYFNQAEGQEIIEDFNDILSGLRKNGVDLEPDEEEAIREWVMSKSISPGFVHRLAEEYGRESIEAAFMVGGHRWVHAVEYLLRRYKGRFYRTRYPTLTIVD